MQHTVKSLINFIKDFKKYSNIKEGPKLKKYFLVAVPVLILFIIIATLAARVQERKRLQALESSEKTDQAFPVKVIETRYTDVSSFVRSSAVIQAWQEALISSEVSGKVKSLYAKVGDHLEPGSPILKIDDEMFGYRVEDAEGRILQLEASYQTSKNDLKRKESLFKGKVISLYEIELVRAKEKTDRGLLASAQAVLKIARRDLRETLIKSPISGILAERLVDLGTDVTKGQKIASVVYIDRVKVTIGATEKERAKIEEGQSVQITTVPYPEKIYKGSVYSVGMKADDATLTFPAEIVVENNQGPLQKPGMVARVAIETAMHRGVIVISQESLIKASDDYFVWSIKDGRARKVRVDPGITVGSQIIVQKGLKPETLLVTFGHENLFEGSPVKIIE
jgi:RND family efflux transporter MFP subunit